MKESVCVLVSMLFYLVASTQTKQVDNPAAISSFQEQSGAQESMIKLPKVGGIEDVKNPEPGMMIYDTIRKQVWYYADEWVMMLGSRPGSGYIHIDEDGSMTLIGEATAWEDVRVAATSTLASGSNPPVYERLLNNGRGSRGVMAWFFEDTDKARDQNEIYFEVQLPHQWRSGSGIRPHVHWVPTDNTTSGSVRWGLEFSWANINERLTKTEIIYATSRTIDRGESGVHIITPLPEIDGTGKGISSMLLCRLFRDSSHPDDTYKTWSGFLEFDFHYEVSSLGSREEYIK